jgi:TonB family protein
MSTLNAFYHSPVLPWSIQEEEEERYRRILKRSFIVFLLLALVLPWLPVPKMDRAKVEQVPPRLAKLLLERQPPPPPPVKLPEPEAPKAEAPKPATPKAEKKPAPTPQKRIEAARAKAERSGLLAFKDDLADLRSHTLPTTIPQSRKLSTGAAASAVTAAPERSVIASRTTSGSGGINTAALSRDTGGGGLGGQAGGTRLSSPLGSGAGGGGGVKRGGSGMASRSVEEIKLVFDRNKGSIYLLYNRALRENPSLQGKVVLKLTIDPSGRVRDCQIVSSELKSPELERKLVARVKQFNFGAKQTDVMVVTYPIDFLPS